MEITELTVPGDHEQVVSCRDDDAGLRAIIAIHSTRLGPSLGGTRFYPFASEDDALTDVLRLSRAMSYKSAAAGLDHGGGKAVIIGDPRTDKTASVFESYGRFIDALDGRYITTEDVGTSEADMNVIRTQTRFVTGTSSERGGSGDPSEATAWGLYCAIRMLGRRLWSAETLFGLRVAIQGVGKVGGYLAGYLATHGCELTIADVSVEATDRVRTATGADVVPPESIHATECDIYSPCALADALSAQTIPALRCRAVAGCANNQLASDESAALLTQRGIVYAPDFIVNAGGVINVAHEWAGYDKERAFAHVGQIGQTLERVLDLAETKGITTAEAAEEIAEERLEG